MPSRKVYEAGMEVLNAIKEFLTQEFGGFEVNHEHDSTLFVKATNGELVIVGVRPSNFVTPTERHMLKSTGEISDHDVDILGEIRGQQRTQNLKRS